MRVMTLVAVLFAVSGCDNTVFPGEGGSSGGGDARSADADGVMAYLDEKCGSCHAEGGQWPNFPSDLEADINDGVGDVVVPGDPDASLLWQVLAAPGDGSGASPMPFGRTSDINELDVQHIRLWIYDGATL